jgi:bifunctional DNA-binding transcriptional regulator/antitoxin component of YhaV-PrlF toxin-antitoxin module
MAEQIEVRIMPNGRMVLPKAARAALGLAGAGVIAVSVEGDEVKLTSMAASIRKAQALYQAHVKDDQSSEDFLEARKAEAAREPV